MDAGKTGLLINEIRKEQGLTQTQLAEKLNVSNRTISKWENGDGFPDISILSVLADVLGITVDEILSGQRFEKKKENADSEVRFLIKSPQSIKSYSRLHKCLNFGNHSKGIAIFSAICSFALLFGFAAYIHAGYELATLPFILLIISFILLILFYALPYIAGAFDMSAAKERCNGAELIETAVFTDEITIINGKVKLDFNYEDITFFKELKDIFVMRLGKYSAVYFSKNGFSLGDANEFSSFISKLYTEKNVGRKKLIKALNNVILIVLGFLTGFCAALLFYISLT